MSITWIGRVGCCEHGIWFRESDYTEPNPCPYCNAAERTPEGKILKELENIRKELRRR